MLKYLFAPTMRHAAKRRPLLGVEELERRLAPATLVSATTLTYQQPDGDNVTVTLSKPLLTSATIAAHVFVFSPAGVNQSNTVAQQLQLVDLAGFSPAQANGLSLTVTATRSATGGEGFANVGAIDAFNINLGTVSIHGDLDAITAGSGSSTTPAIASLTVQSMGLFGTSTESTADLESQINGNITALNVASDIEGASIFAHNITTVSVGGSLSGEIDASGNIGTVTIGGDLVGNSVNDSGAIVSSGTITTVTVSGSLQGNVGVSSGSIAAGKLGTVTVQGDVSGGDGQTSGTILTLGESGNIGSVTIDGNLVGGTGSSSGEVSAPTLGPVTIDGQVEGGSGSFSGTVGASTMNNVTVKGAVLGGAGENSGAITSVQNIGTVSVAGDLQGGGGVDSGTIHAGGNMVAVTVGGSVIGGSANSSGEVATTGSLGPVTIGHDLRGGVAPDSGDIVSGGSLGAVTVGGSLIAGSQNTSGLILAGNIGLVTVGGSLDGGPGASSGAIDSNGSIAGVKVGYSLIGGAGETSGSITSVGNMGTVTIGGIVQGGSGSKSGAVISGGALTGVTVTGSVIGGTGDDSGVILATGNLGPVVIGGSLVGGSIVGPPPQVLAGTGYVQAQNIASVKVGGSIVAGTALDENDIVLTQSGSIRASGAIGPITVDGSLVGNGVNPVIISAGGVVTLPKSATQDVALTSVTVLGRVERADILAGYDVNTNPVNGNASIGPVSVGLDWIASSIAAGVETADGSLNFGQLTDHEIDAGRSPDLISTIASIVIGGQAVGSTNALEHFGFVAEEVGALSVGGTKFDLIPGPHHNDLVVGATDNLTLFEVA